MLQVQFLDFLVRENVNEPSFKFCLVTDEEILKIELLELLRE